VARKNELVSTKYPNIYQVLNRYNKQDFVADFRWNGKHYREKNLSKLFSATSASHASRLLTEIKIDIQKGNDPFAKKTKEVDTKTFSELVLSEIDNRNTSARYKQIQTSTYNKHIHPKLGHMNIKNITIDILNKLFSELQKTLSPSSIKNLRKTIAPTFAYAFDEDIIQKNPLTTERLKRKIRGAKSLKAPLKHRLSGRDDKRFINTAKAIYNAAKVFEKKDQRRKVKEVPDLELQVVFLIVVMTGRRRGETLEIKYEDITEYGTVKTIPDMTKSDIWEEYPLPSEVLDKLDLKNGTGKITPNVTPDIYSKHMRYLLDSIKIKIHSNMKITGHDTRNLFLTIMSKKTKNPFLVDSALSHSESKYELLRTYYEPDINDFIELFNDYWKLLRSTS